MCLRQRNARCKSRREYFQSLTWWGIMRKPITTAILVALVGAGSVLASSDPLGAASRQPAGTKSSMQKSAAGTAREDTIRLYAKGLAGRGKAVTPDMLNIMVDCYVADTKARAAAEAGKAMMYFANTLVAYDHPSQDFQKTTGYYGDKAQSHLRGGVKGTLADTSLFHARLTEEQVRAQAEHMAWGPADECVERIIAEADQAGAGTLLLMCNRGGLPHEMFIEQIRRIGAEVLPRLKAHQVTRVPFAEGVEI